MFEVTTPRSAEASPAAPGSADDSGRALRIAVLLDLSPRKLGSLEEWVLGLATGAIKRGHAVSVFGSDPLHPSVRSGLDLAGATWATTDSLVRRPFAAVRRLARGFDVLHLNLFAPRDPIPLLAYAAWPARVLFVDHFSDTGRTGSIGRRIVRRLLDGLVATRIAGYVGVSNYVRDRARSRFGWSDGFGETIYDGINVERFVPAPAPRGDAVRIATVANLIPEKGIDVLIRAFAAIDRRDVALDIVGDGPEEEALRVLALELGVADRVRFCGLRDDVDQLLHRAEVFVHPAIWQEAFGLTVTEAMACGCAVVASNVGALPELIVDGESGCLVSPGDVGALVAALRRLIDDPDLRRRFAREGRARVVARFRIEHSIARHIERCESIASSRRGGRHELA